MKKHFYVLATATALSLGAATAANAVVIDLTAATNFSGTFVATSSNTLVEIGGPSGITGVQQQDKLFDNFAFATGDLIQFTFNHVGTQDFHTITISNPTFATTGGSVGYTVSVTSPLAVLDSVSGAVVQTQGSVHVVTTLAPNVGAAGPLDFTQTNPIPGNPVGTSTASFAAGTTSVGVLDTLTPGLGGSTVSAVSNSFVETLASPGPVPGAGLGGMVALLGLGLLARARGLAAR